MAKEYKPVSNVTIVVPFDGPELQRRLKRAQAKLNLQIVADSDPFTPFDQGGLRGSVRYPQGVAGNLIEYDTPYAHYQWEGIVYGPNIPIYDDSGNVTGWFSPPGKKKKPTGAVLQYHTKGTGDHWTDKAKEKHMKEWEQLVIDELLG